jgi:small subunit ribosomal protein S6
LNPYEMTFIIRPDRDEDGTRAVAEAVTGRISAAGGEIIAAIPWNPPRRRMAYPIKDFGDGFYVTTVFRVDPTALGPIENALKLNENILRFLIVQATDLNIKQAQQRLQQQQAAAQAPAPQQPPAGAVPQNTVPLAPQETPAGVTEDLEPIPEAATVAPPEIEVEPVIGTEAADAASIAPEPAENVSEPAAEPVAEPAEAARVTEPATAGTSTEPQE